MNIGGASILLLITVFALTVFAVLAIRASYNERQMAKRGRDAVERYYEADVRAEEICEKLFAAAEKAGEGVPVQEVLEASGLGGQDGVQVQGDCLVCEIGVDHNRTLRIVVEFFGGKPSVKEWRLISGASGSYDEVIDLWDGVFTE